MISNGIEAECKSTEPGFGSRFGNFIFSSSRSHLACLLTTHLVTLASSMYLGIFTDYSLCLWLSVDTWMGQIGPYLDLQCVNNNFLPQSQD
jgi:hypothetical protein